MTPESTDWPLDCWVDVETGEWGLRSNLRLVRQVDLPSAIGDKSLPTEAVAALVRCAGYDHGIPLSSSGGSS